MSVDSYPFGVSAALAVSVSPVLVVVVLNVQDTYRSGSYGVIDVDEDLLEVDHISDILG